MRWRKRKPNKTKAPHLVLGQHAATASAAETTHRNQHPSEESLLTGLAYDQVRHDGTWICPEWSSVCTAITTAVTQFGQAQPLDRISITTALTMEDFYLLCAYAKRCASFALAEHDVQHIANGLTALAAIDPKRIDPRDISWSASHLRLALTKLTTSRKADKQFEHAAALAEPTTAKTLRSFLGTSYDELTHNWRMLVVELEGGLVIVEQGRGRYEPTADLLHAGHRIAGLLIADGLRPGRPTLGGQVATVWLRSTPQAQTLLERATATLAIGASSRDGALDQLFLVFLFEMLSTEDQTTFTNAWSQGSRHFPSLAVGANRLVALFITNSSVAGIPPAEADRTLERFVDETREVLNTTISDE